MIRRRLVTMLLGASLITLGGIATFGCGGDEGQPARESISAPRKGGGVTDTAGEKVKSKTAAAGGAGNARPKAD
jgi:hypothetical protein